MLIKIIITRIQIGNLISRSSNMSTLQYFEEISIKCFVCSRSGTQSHEFNAHSLLKCSSIPEYQMSKHTLQNMHLVQYRTNFMPVCQVARRYQDFVCRSTRAQQKDRREFKSSSSTMFLYYWKVQSSFRTTSQFIWTFRQFLVRNRSTMNFLQLDYFELFNCELVRNTKIISLRFKLLIKY